MTKFVTKDGKLDFRPIKSDGTKSADETNADAKETKEDALAEPASNPNNLTNPDPAPASVPAADLVPAPASVPAHQ